MRAAAVLSRGIETISDSYKILTSALARETRIAILASYLANGLRSAASKTSARETATFGVFGWKVRCLDQNAFLASFNEIFVDLCYVPASDRPQPLIIDGGSNIGLSVLFFKRLYPDATVLAFEPDREAFSCLRENVDGAGLSDVRLHECALSDTDGQVDFFFDPDQPGSRKHSIIEERVPVASRRVKASRLSGFIDQEVDFMKLDVEGAEQRVLRDLQAEDKLRLVRELAIEYHHYIVETDDSLSEILALLEGAGFGYELSGRSERPLGQGRAQDLLIYAYRKP